ncbi:unnamed protein product [Effrenium voratum]|nr:unnamed protein product [Effrenium voratum]
MEFSSSEGESSSDIDSIKLDNVAKNPAWHFVVVTSAFTFGIVFSPYTLGAAGWFWGSAFWIFSTATTWVSGILIGHCVMEAVARGKGYSYPDMMADGFGRAGYIFAVTMQVSTYYLVNIALFVDISNWLLLAQEGIDILTEKTPFLGHRFCFCDMLLLTGAAATCLAQVRTFRGLIFWAAVSLACTIARIMILVYQIGAHDLLQECRPSFDGITATSTFNSLATTAFLFGGHGLFPEEMAELRRPESYFPALHASYVVLILGYGLNTYLAYAVWGEWTAGDNQFNWPLNGATLTSSFLSAVWGILEMTTSHVMLLNTVEKHPWVKAILDKRGSCYSRALIRATFVWTEVFWAFMFSAAGIANIQAFVGAFGFTSLTYYAPFAAYWKLLRRTSDRHRGDARLLKQRAHDDIVSILKTWYSQGEPTMGLSVRLFDPYGYAFKARNRTGHCAFGGGKLMQLGVLSFSSRMQDIVLESGAGAAGSFLRLTHGKGQAWAAWWGLMELLGTQVSPHISRHPVKAITDCIIWRLTPPSLRKLQKAFPAECRILEKVALHHAQILQPKAMALHQAPFFQGASRGFLEALQKASTRWILASGEVVYEKGKTDLTRDLFCVARGTVRVVAANVDRSRLMAAAGRQTRRAGVQDELLGEGAVFGENLALQLRNTRAMSVVSETICDLHVMPGASFKQCCVPSRAQQEICLHTG